MDEAETRHIKKPVEQMSKRLITTNCEVIASSNNDNNLIYISCALQMRC